ncbi:hypothetical protein GCM10027421_08260 [Microbacterium shaanxiense]
MSEHDPEPADSSIVRVAVPLSRIVMAIDRGDVDAEDYAVYAVDPDARATSDPLCVLDDLILVTDDLEEVLPALVVAERLVTFCPYAGYITDTIVNTREQSPDAGIATILANLDHFLVHDTWMDLT